MVGKLLDHKALNVAHILDDHHKILRHNLDDRIHHSRGLLHMDALGKGWHILGGHLHGNPSMDEHKYNQVRLRFFSLVDTIVYRDADEGGVHVWQSRFRPYFRWCVE